MTADSDLPTGRLGELQSAHWPNNALDEKTKNVSDKHNDVIVFIMFSSFTFNAIIRQNPLALLLD